VEEEVGDVADLI